MKKFIILNLLMSLLLTADANCMMRRFNYEKLIKSISVKNAFSVNNVYGVVTAIPVPSSILSVQNSMLPLLKQSVSDDLLKQDAHFKDLGILYSDSIVLDSDLKGYSKLVSEQGFNKSILPNHLIPGIVEIPKNCIDYKLEIKKVDDTVGYGVFAKEKIPAGSFIKQYTGNVKAVDGSKKDDNNESNYLLQVSDMDKLWLVIDAEHVGNESRFFNHSYDPNCTVKIAYIFGQTETVQMWIVATKDILPGEEICWDYGCEYWQRKKIVPVEKNIKNIYQDKYFTFYSNPIENGVSKLFINGEVLRMGDGSEYLSEILHVSIDDKDQNNVVVFIVTKYQGKIFPVITIFKKGELCEEIFFSFKFSEYPEDIKKSFFILLDDLGLNPYKK